MATHSIPAPRDYSKENADAAKLEAEKKNALNKVSSELVKTKSEIGTKFHAVINPVSPEEQQKKQDEEERIKREKEATKLAEEKKRIRDERRKEEEEERKDQAEQKTEEKRLEKLRLADEKKEKDEEEKELFKEEKPKAEPRIKRMHDETIEEIDQKYKPTSPRYRDLDSTIKEDIAEYVKNSKKAADKVLSTFQIDDLANCKNTVQLGNCIRLFNTKMEKILDSLEEDVKSLTTKPPEAPKKSWWNKLTGK